MMSRQLPTRQHAILRCMFVAVTALVCAGVLAAAALVPAPAGVLPFVIVICLGLSMSAATELPGAIAALRRRPTPLDARALDRLRRHLDELPETQHPLGL